MGVHAKKTLAAGRRHLGPAMACGLFVLALVNVGFGTPANAVDTQASDIQIALLCRYSSGNDSGGQYQIRWMPMGGTSDVRITSASRGTIYGYDYDGYGHDVGESMPGSTAGMITNTIAWTATDPGSQERVPFTETVSLVLAGDCAAHQPEGLLDGVGFGVSVTLSCSADDNPYAINWTLRSEVSGKYLALESATVGAITHRADLVRHSEPQSSVGTISNTISGYLAESSEPSNREQFETTIVASLVEPCRDPAVPVGCLGAPATPLAHKAGLVDPTTGRWHLYDCANDEARSFVFGNPGDIPFMGDWDGNGSETPGLFRQSDGYIYLRNSNTSGNADIRYRYGNPGDIPLAGDFNGDGFDTVSVYRPSNQTVYISNRLGSNGGGIGAADNAYVFGNPGDQPFVGDFNGNGTETIGLHRASTGHVYLRNTHTQGVADTMFTFGNPGDRMVAGDWTGDEVFTPAVFRPSNTTTYLRYANDSGNGDFAFVAGQHAWLPVSGWPGTP